MNIGLKVEYIATSELVPHAGNARVHSAKQVKQIAKSIEKFGFMNPVLIDAKGVLIAGHGRVLAAKQLKLERVPALRFEHLTEAQRRAYALADNKLAENATWDEELLRIEVNFLIEENEIDFDALGFSTPEIDIVLGDPDEEQEGEGEAESAPPIAKPVGGDIVSKRGDLWLLGDHRLLCGDCRSVDEMKRLLRKDTARMVITDPPYNVPIAGHVSGLGQHQHAEFVMGVGEMSAKDFADFLVMSLRSLSGACCEGALLYCFMDWRHIRDLLEAGAAADLDLQNLCVWVKSNGGMGSLYRSQHELVAVLKKGGAAHINNVELGKHGRYRTNVWQYAGMNSFGVERGEALAAHPTVKPVAMIRDAILDTTNLGDVVLDGFLGSGTTLLAADLCKRRCLGVELDPGYVDVAVQRWIDTTGGKAVHAESGISFSELQAQRLAAAA